MRQICIIIGILVIVACSTDAPPDATVPVQAGPVLDESVVLDLARTLIIQGSGGCNEQLGAIVEQEVEVGHKYYNALFKDTGVWLATIGVCVFVVDDSTGKVTGP